MATFAFPTSLELREVEQEKLPRLEAARPIFRFLPTEEVEDHWLSWEQQDNYIGLQQLRGLGGEPPRVKKVGAKRYLAEPGVYGEFLDLDEAELTRRRTLGTFDQPINVEDMVMSLQDQLLQRRLDRIEYIGWNALLGTFSVATPTGAVVHTDTWSPQTFSAGVGWGTAATAVPLANFRAVQLLGPARGANFGSGATALLNRTTFNQMLANTNAADFGGKRTTGLAPINDLQGANRLLAGEDLPTIEVYDDGYLDDSSVFQRFIPNSKVIVIGTRPSGRRIGAYRYTRNVNNQNMAPGPYTKVVDNGEDHVPRRIDVHDGHNGGPIIEFPGSIVIMSV